MLIGPSSPSCTAVGTHFASLCAVLTASTTATLSLLPPSAPQFLDAFLIVCLASLMLLPVSPLWALRFRAVEVQQRVHRTVARKRLTGEGGK
jgi:hypothetical protein